MKTSAENIIETRTLAGREITLFSRHFDYGFMITVSGGDKSHIGAVTVADENADCSTIVLPGHREDVITRKWAPILRKVTGEPVSVTAGIHFDNASGEEILQILDTVDDLMNVFINCI